METVRKKSTSIFLYLGGIVCLIGSMFWGFGSGIALDVYFTTSQKSTSVLTTVLTTMGLTSLFVGFTVFNFIIASGKFGSRNWNRKVPYVVILVDILLVLWSIIFSTFALLSRPY